MLYWDGRPGAERPGDRCVHCWGWAGRHLYFRNGARGYYFWARAIISGAWIAWVFMSQIFWGLMTVYRVYSGYLYIYKSYYNILLLLVESDSARMTNKITHHTKTETGDSMVD